MSATPDAPPLEDRSQLSRDAGDVACPECGRMFTPGAGLARHRSRIHDVKPQGVSTTYKRAKRERERIASGDEKLWDTGRDLPPKTRADGPTPRTPPAPGAATGVYVPGVAQVGFAFTLLGIFDDWDVEHWGKASPAWAKELELFVARHPRAKVVTDLAFGGVGDKGGLAFATLGLFGPMLAHHGKIPYPGIEADKRYGYNPIRIPRPPKRARPGSGVPRGAVVGDSVPGAPSPPDGPPPPPDQSETPDPTMYGPPAESVDPNAFTAADGPAAGIPPDAVEQNGSTDEMGEPL